LFQLLNQERSRNSEQFDWLERLQICTASTPGRLCPCGALVTATASTMASRIANKALTGGVFAFMQSFAIENVILTASFRIGRPVRQGCLPLCRTGHTTALAKACRRSSRAKVWSNRSGRHVRRRFGSRKGPKRPGRKGGLGRAERALSARAFTAHR
jgi:hypothetical protein